MSVQARQRWASGVFARGIKFRHDGWSAAEVEVVRRMAGTARLVEIVAALRSECRTERTVLAVHAMAHNHRIRLSRRGYSTPALAAAFGVSDDLVRTWIETGELAAKRWDGGFGRPGKTPWLVSQSAVEAFIRSRTWLYDVTLMEQDHALYGVARAANRGERWLGSKELAARLGMKCASYMGLLASREVIPSERRGTVWMFRESTVREIQEILKARRAAHRQSLRTLRLKRWHAEAEAA